MLYGLTYCQVSSCNGLATKRGKFKCKSKHFGAATHRGMLYIPMCDYHFKLLSSVIIGNVYIKWECEQGTHVFIEKFIEEISLDRRGVIDDK